MKKEKGCEDNYFHEGLYGGWYPAPHPRDSQALYYKELIELKKRELTLLEEMNKKLGLLSTLGV